MATPKSPEGVGEGEEGLAFSLQFPGVDPENALFLPEHPGQLNFVGGEILEINEQIQQGDHSQEWKLKLLQQLSVQELDLYVKICSIDATMQSIIDSVAPPTIPVEPQS